MAKLFISHSSKDDAFVRDLRDALADLGQDGWIDSRELGGGDPLWAEIQKAIDEASAYAIVVSTDSLQSKWVAKELQYALKVREERGKDKFPVIPLSLNGTKLGAFEIIIGEEPIFIQVRSEAGGVEEALNELLVAMGERPRADIAATVQPKAEPLEELVLELTDLKFREQDGVSRASARARLIYESATLGQPPVISEQSWRLIAPIGAVEAEDLRWYLEKYAGSTSHYFRERAQKVEHNLVKWGQFLHQKAFPVDHTANVMNAWSKIADDADRRFSVYVDTALEAGTPDDEVKTAREAAALLLALPWELLHDGEGYLFQGAKPMRVRRRLPNTKVLNVPVVAPPIRILLITARPEDDSCGYIDHRTSAIPLVEAMASLPGLVKINILSPPTLPALRAELDRARSENKPYHVVHFDGYGAFDREVGMGGLCFENPEDIGKLEQRGHVTVFTNDLGPLLRDHRIPLVFIEAYQTADADSASDSVASELLKVGVASVVAMSHNLMLETTARFVGAFYKALTRGDRVGDAMLAGQRELKDNTFRGYIFGAGELRLEDWFVPVLYQEKDDPQLFKTVPAKQTQEDFRAALAARLGDLPPVAETGFIGRSRDLLALQRLLRAEQYAVVRSQGGAGSTTFVAEFARWMVKSQRMRRAAFVSVETHDNQRAVVEALGKQLVQRNFSAAGDLEEAIRKIERALREQSALLVIDSMESILLPPFMQKESPETFSADARAELKAILALCERLLKAGDTRIVFTSREALPAPFDAERHRRELYQLDPEDAVKLVESMLNGAGSNAGTFHDAAREEIAELVDAVHSHARTLALLAPSLRERGVEATRESLFELMAETEKNFPGSREKSVFASVEMSLRRMSEANRNRARALAVFHGGVHLRMLANMMQWQHADVSSLADELIETGLATRDNDHLTLNPALCPYLRSGMDAGELEQLTTRWVEEMSSYVSFLVAEQTQNPEAVARLTMLEAANLFALVELAQAQFDAENTVGLAGLLYSLLETAGRSRLLERVAQVREAATALLSDNWTYAQFEAAHTRIEQQLAAGQLREALEAAQTLHQRAMEAGEQAFPGADYVMATTCWGLGGVLRITGNADEALALLDEARRRFEAIAIERPGTAAEEMAAKCFSEIGACLNDLGRADEAIAAYEERIRRGEQIGDHRGIAVGKFQIGSIRLNQGLYQEAQEAFTDALERFAPLNELGMVGDICEKLGIVYHNSGEPKAAEDAYRESLEIAGQLGNVTSEASVLNQLGMLYQGIPERLEEAPRFFQQAAEKSIETGDISSEAYYRNNLADSLRQLKQFDKARHESLRAIDCDSKLGNAGRLSVSWAHLAAIETDAGNFSASADAKSNAIACYLTYRRDGGENPAVESRMSLEVTNLLLAGDDANATSFLQERAAEPDVPASFRTYISALQSIVDGSRDPALADAPDLDYGMAGEILLLIETLEKQQTEKPPVRAKKSTKKSATKSPTKKSRTKKSS